MLLLKYLLRVLRSVDHAVSRRIGSKKVLFVVSDGYGFACQYPVMKELIARAGVEVFATPDKPVHPSELNFNTSPEKSLFSDHYIDYKTATFKKWDLIVNTHVNGFYPRRRALSAYMHHGPGFGILGNKIAIAKKYDVFFGLSLKQKNILEKIDPEVFGSGRMFYPVGFPKSDETVNASISRETILNKYALPDRKTILITSHWQPGSTIRTLHHTPFELIAMKYDQYNVIQTGHPWLWNEKSEEAWRDTLIENLVRIENSNSNARFLPNASAEELLSITDLLVADQSSVMTTFSLYDRPIVFFDNLEVEFAIKEIEELYRDASHTFSSSEEVLEAIESAIRSPEELNKGRKAMKDVFYENVGFSAKKMAGDI